MSRRSDPEEINGSVMRAQVRWKQEREGFKEVVKSEWFIVLLGLSIGVGLILLPHYFSSLHHHSTTTLLFEHLGLGFIVSSIAVFGYEWRSHAKNVIELGKKLQKSIEDVERIRKTMILSKAQVDVLTTKAEEALDCSLRVYIGENWAGLREELKSLIAAISHIERQETWVRDRYLKVVQWLLRETVLDNAKAFEDLTNQDPRGEQHFKVPTAATMADKILSTQMELMGPGDSYDVISDITSWRDNSLEAFRRESVRALLEGVKVRRVFNRFRLDLPSITDPAYDEMCKKTTQTLKDHLRYSIENRGYQVKVLGQAELDKLLNMANGKRKENPIFTRAKIEKAHFGLFKQGPAPRTVIRFMVKEPDLSDMELCSNPSLINDDLNLFGSVWRSSTPLTEKLIEDLEEELIPQAKQ